MRNPYRLALSRGNLGELYFRDRRSLHVPVGFFLKSGLKAFTKECERLGVRLKFQFLARINLLYAAFKMTAGWIGFWSQSNDECASHNEGRLKVR